jgi:hypothetical protein
VRHISLPLPVQKKPNKTGFGNTIVGFFSEINVLPSPLDVIFVLSGPGLPMNAMIEPERVFAV